MTYEKQSDSKVRALAKREGYQVLKARGAQNLDNRGEYMLVDAETNFPSIGWRYDASAEDIEAFLRT